MSDSLYHQNIFALAKSRQDDPPLCGENILRAHCSNPLCGDSVKLSAKVESTAPAKQKDSAALQKESDSVALSARTNFVASAKKTDSAASVERMDSVALPGRRESLQILRLSQQTRGCVLCEAATAQMIRLAQNADTARLRAICQAAEKMFAAQTPQSAQSESTNANSEFGFAKLESENAKPEFGSNAEKFADDKKFASGEKAEFKPDATISESETVDGIPESETGTVISESESIITIPEFALFAPVIAHPARHECVLLPFRALSKILAAL